MEGFLALEFEEANMRSNVLHAGTWQRRWCWLEIAWFREPALSPVFLQADQFRRSVRTDEPSALLVRLVRAKGRELRENKRKESLVIGPWTVVDVDDDVGQDYDALCDAASKFAGTENIMRPPKENKNIMAAPQAGCVVTTSLPVLRYGQPTAMPILADLGPTNEYVPVCAFWCSFGGSQATATNVCISCQTLLGRC